MILGAGRHRHISTTADQVITARDTNTNETDGFSSGSDVDSNAEQMSEGKLDDIAHEETLEPWVAWIRRVTHRIEEQARKLNIQSWISKARAAKWKWAQQVVQHDASRWTHQVLFWDPELYSDEPRGRAHRRQGRSNLRWADEITQFFHHHQTTTRWQDTAANKNAWDKLTDDFCKGCWRN